MTRAPDLSTDNAGEELFFTGNPFGIVL